MGLVLGYVKLTEFSSQNSSSKNNLNYSKSNNLIPKIYNNETVEKDQFWTERAPQSNPSRYYPSNHSSGNSKLETLKSKQSKMIERDLSSNSKLQRSNSSVNSSSACLLNNKIKNSTNLHKYKTEYPSLNRITNLSKSKTPTSQPYSLPSKRTSSERTLQITQSSINHTKTKVIVSQTTSKINENYRNINASGSDHSRHINKKTPGELCEEHQKEIYKGKYRCFGYYQCTCKRTWESANSWAGYHQDCTKCGQRVKPKCQHALKKSNNPEDPEKHHLSELCEKCQELGRSCRMTAT